MLTEYGRMLIRARLGFLRGGAHGPAAPRRKDWYTTREVEAISGVSSSVCLKWAAQHSVRRDGRGGGFRWEQKDLDAFLWERRGSEEKVAAARERYARGIPEGAVQGAAERIEKMLWNESDGAYINWVREGI